MRSRSLYCTPCAVGHRSVRSARKVTLVYTVRKRPPCCFQRPIQTARHTIYETTVRLPTKEEDLKYMNTGSKVLHEGSDDDLTEVMIQSRDVMVLKDRESQLPSNK